MNAISQFVGSIMEWLFHLTELAGIPSYALAIVLLTLIIKLILYPLTIKQQKSMQAMQQVQPLMQELSVKYKNDPQKYQQEMQKLYKEYGASPFSGCLPMLIQLPILILLYRGLLNFVPAQPEFYHFLWLTDLSKPDPTGIVMPILVALFTLFQQFVSSTNLQDRTQKMMLFMMPIMMGWIVRSLPSGLSIYWVSFMVLGILQQILMNKGLRPRPIVAKSEAAAEGAAGVGAAKSSLKEALQEAKKAAAEEEKKKSSVFDDACDFEDVEVPPDDYSRTRAKAAAAPAAPAKKKKKKKK